jgi:hypothetical protein
MSSLPPLPAPQDLHKREIESTDYWNTCFYKLTKIYFLVLVFIRFFSTHLLYIICRICNNCICLISTGFCMSYAHWRNSYTIFFVSLVIIVILVLGFDSGLSSGVRTVYLFSLRVVSLLSSRFTATALVWFSSVFGIPLFYFMEHCVHMHIFINSVIVYVLRCIQNGSDSLGLKALEDFNIEIGSCPP